jgi:hypothetical protein
MRVVRVMSDAKAREKPCLRCGYSLRKLLDARYCPECGLSVWLSLNPDDSLDRSSPPWTRRLAMSSWIMAAAQIIGLAALVVAWWHHRQIRIAISRTTTRPFTLGYSMYAMWQTISFASGAYLLLYSAALFAFASNEGRHPDKWKTYRFTCRAAAVFGGLVGIYVLKFGTGMLFQLALLGGTIAALAYLRALARRIPNSRLARFCAFLLLGPALSLLKTFPVFWMFAAFQFGNIFDYLPWAYLPLSAALMVWFAILFRRASKQAVKEWAAETAPGADLSTVVK